MEQLKASDRIVLSTSQLHGRISTLHEGEIVSIEGSSATVLLDGEDIPRTVTLDTLQSEQALYGGELNRPNELPVIDAIRR